MPYKLRGNCVVRADTGETVPGGCHGSRVKAMAHLAALRINVHKESSDWEERVKAYDPRQLRWPKGTPMGGQWKASGVSGRMLDSVAVGGGATGFSNIVTVRKGFLAGREARAVTSTVRSINGIHKVKGLPNLLIRTVGNPSHPFFGAYHWNRGIIEVTSAGATPHMTTAHEIGHFLDHKGFGWGSANSAKFAGWRQAVENSANIRQWRQWEKRGNGIFGRFRLPMPRAVTRYYLNPREIWARSYAQFIAHRSGNRSMLRELRFLRTSGRYRTQWDDNDFKPIAREIEKLLRSEGWL